jgi:hypothetical protein
MPNLGPAGETAALDALLAGRFIGLHKSDPGPTGTGEVTGGAYARQPATFVKAGTNPTVSSNNALVQFPVATAPWGAITHFALWSAVSGGSCIIYAPVTTPKTIDTDDIARWEAGALQVSTD